MATARAGWCATAFVVFGLLAAASAGPARSTVSSYGDAVLGDQPMAFWRLNDAAGSTRFADSSGHGYVLTPDGQDTLGVGGALDGDSNAGMHTPTSSATSDWGNAVGTVYTAEFWYSADAPAGPNGIGLVSYNSGSSRGRNWVVRITSSGFTYHSKNRKNYPLTTLRHDFPHAHWWLFHLRDQF
jgi:hypothetical protein